MKKNSALDLDAEKEKKRNCQDDGSPSTTGENCLVVIEMQEKYGLTTVDCSLTAV